MALQLEIVEENARVATSFLEWHATICETPDVDGPASKIDGTDVWFSRNMRHKGKVHLDFWVTGADGTAVQLNQPRGGGTEAPGTTIALDAKGRRYVVRQGDIHGSQKFERIQWDEFSRKTGLTPVGMEMAGSPARKQWHVVASLDSGNAFTIRQETADFVRRCWNARIYGRDAGHDQQRARTLFGSRESGGWYDVDPALTPIRVLRTQGYVSECLTSILDSFGIELAKPRHFANYEVDGTVDALGGPILIEIKTGTSAADVYCGVGQLNLYPVLLDDLTQHSRILLLPGEPTRHLVEALQTCGIELHSYELVRGRRKATARFSAAFLRRCGVPDAGLQDLVRKGEAIA